MRSGSKPVRIEQRAGLELCQKIDVIAPALWLWNCVRAVAVRGAAPAEEAAGSTEILQELDGIITVRGRCDTDRPSAGRCALTTAGVHRGGDQAALKKWMKIPVNSEMRAGGCMPALCAPRSEDTLNTVQDFSLNFLCCYLDTSVFLSYTRLCFAAKLHVSSGARYQSGVSYTGFTQLLSYTGPLQLMCHLWR